MLIYYKNLFKYQKNLNIAKATIKPDNSNAKEVFKKTGWYKEEFWYTYPVVAETYDGFLNDIYGFHVKENNAFEALDSAKSGLLKEGNVGGGTGMMCLGFKGGTGTASRVIKIKDSIYTIGVLVQSNFGSKNNFTIYIHL